MARSHRFHVDRDGHSVTVQTGSAGLASSGVVELLVDGKVVASQRSRPHDVTVLAAELPGEPPQPFTAHLDQSPRAGGVPFCSWEVDGHREPLPYAPLAARRAPSPARPVTTHPLRWLRRIARRRLRHLRFHPR
ncbi:hypothetical protein GCM10027072_63210 [Streptomyces bullii]